MQINFIIVYENGELNNMQKDEDYKFYQTQENNKTEVDFTTFDFTVI